MTPSTSYPTDLGVSMSNRVLRHKRDRLAYAIGVDEMYWAFGGSREAPRGVRRGSRLWVANRGRWVGYFTVKLVDVHDISDALIFSPLAFHPRDGGPRTPFRGYTLRVPPREV